ncbi:hypothetical protein BLNAU_2115 [Blattamonas nauphoetae]|uniref:Uncharacterized protein n=1 Tax=Blattamonas nauphoetae TaxID=2049346 RepID=A0ABQ9YH63_9EUKA|nr:hypothetical protein BLNAU_2115 [Blattamonas nauphoetae]
MRTYSHSKNESMFQWLSDSSIHPRNKVFSFQWIHIPTLLTNQIQSQQQKQHPKDEQCSPPTEPNNQYLSSLLELILLILDECFDSHTPIPNQRLLHSTLSQLSDSSLFDLKIKRMAHRCLASLETNEEDSFIVVTKEQLQSMEAVVNSFSNLQQKHEDLQAKLSERDDRIVQLENENRGSLNEKEQIKQDIEQMRKVLANITHSLEENERSLIVPGQTR